MYTNKNEEEQPVVLTGLRGRGTQYENSLVINK